MRVRHFGLHFSEITEKEVGIRHGCEGAASNRRWHELRRKLMYCAHGLEFTSCHILALLVWVDLYEEGPWGFILEQNINATCLRPEAFAMPSDGYDIGSFWQLLRSCQYDMSKLTKGG